jgi:type VI secretion system secreted protein VgrG
VSFEHGNPDRPLVLGCVYNGANHLPYELPTHKSRTVFKTLSTPGGGGFNELSFEDKKGHEQIYMHAQRDWELMVKANAYATIDGDSHRLTHGNAIERVKDDRQELVKQDSFEHLKTDDQLKLNGTFQHQVDQSFLVSVSDELHQNAAIKINMEAGAGLSEQATSTSAARAGSTRSAAIARAWGNGFMASSLSQKAQPVGAAPKNP